MSSDNYLLIDQVNTHTYNIYDCSASWDEDQLDAAMTHMTPLHTEEDLQNAVAWANGYASREIVEYGLSINLLEDKQRRSA